MADSLVTSADATLTLTVKTLFETPVIIENWSASRAWEAQALVLAGTRLSIDGKLNKGFRPSAIDFNLILQPNSNGWEIFDVVQVASRQARTVYTLGMEMTFPGLKRKYTFVNGCIVDLSALPNAGELLEERTVHMIWENILPAGI